MKRQLALFLPLLLLCAQAQPTNALLADATSSELSQMLRSGSDSEKAQAISESERREDVSQAGLLGQMAYKPGVESLRLAALRALATCGTADSVALLATMASNAPKQFRAPARLSLASLPGDDINEMIGFGIEQTPDDFMRIELIQAAASRNATSLVPQLLHIAATAGNTLPLTRTAALNALGQLGTTENLERLIIIVASESHPKPRAAATKALATIITREPADSREIILSAHEQSSGRTKAAILKMMPLVGGDAALAAVMTGLKSDEEVVAKSALHAFANWPGKDPLFRYIDVVKATTNVALRAEACRGVITMQQTREAPMLDQAVLLESFIEQSTTPADVISLIELLPMIPSPHSKALALKLKDDERFTEAVEAIIPEIERAIDAVATP